MRAAQDCGDAAELRRVGDRLVEGVQVEAVVVLPVAGNTEVASLAAVWLHRLQARVDVHLRSEARAVGTLAGEDRVDSVEPDRRRD